jgi:hypothetical protein
MIKQLPEEALLIWPRTSSDVVTSQVAHMGVLLDMYVF